MIVQMPSLRYRYKSDTLTLGGYAACQEVPSTATCMAMYPYLEHVDGSINAFTRDAARERSRLHAPGQD